ncbi:MULTISPECIES: 4'-phosphopantetheinyl transferase superfamily protein [unclassified Leptolyngbya]|uniref:4'-phosphopantetheinyl transferase family protein n=1 Tax=unclassified Leptolyngbya TaxID=2650499 RepID=UPI0016874B44|nr:MULTISPECIES: 4'-phosphopantetheinyl transferase superfamily protein [unclassified Leptolyngbya]MBD1914195.1 4'-phosphopantetheinyl transferase superfamily protein [Leptolyngbya sp. FACHB-8]MBD2157202.1 4'-phosphopantetheinyl transferase superfamily protein [Leptolyngbya sp. FACHB-16]
MMQPDWSHPLDPQTLAEGQVHIWRAYCVRSPEFLNQTKLWLSADELQRAARFRFERDRDRFITGRGFLRQILGAYLNRPPESLQFDYGKYGKPSLVNASGIQFNLTHSEDWALYAIALIPVGIDLEAMRPVPQMESIVQRYFSPQEQKTFSALPERDQALAFFRAWTCKEAYLKATGHGLTLPLNQIDVELTPNKLPKFHQLPDGQRPSHWPLWSFNISSQLQAAVTVQSKAGKLPALAFGEWSER